MKRLALAVRQNPLSTSCRVATTRIALGSAHHQPALNALVLRACAPTAADLASHQILSQVHAFRRQEHVRRTRAARMRTSAKQAGKFHSSARLGEATDFAMGRLPTQPLRDVPMHAERGQRVAFHLQSSQFAMGDLAHTRERKVQSLLRVSPNRHQ